MSSYDLAKPSTPIAQTFISSRDMRTTVTAVPATVADDVPNSTSGRNANQVNDNHIYQNESKLANDIVVAVLTLTTLLVAIAIMHFMVEPFQRGFFCDDQSIRYPYKKNTIPSKILIIGVLALPIPLIAGMEMIINFHQKRGPREYIKCFCMKVPTWLYDSIRHFYFYLLGLTFILVAMELAKIVIGRLRPHFIAVCQPEFPDGSSCKDPQNQNIYIEDYICPAIGFQQKDVHEARLSFFSGHASLSMYSCLYLAIYMEVQLKWMRLRFLRHFLQFSLLMLAWFIALTRIMDFWHHMSDVLVGIIIGLITAIVIAKYVSRLSELENSPNSFRLNNIPRHDTTATLHDML